MRRIIASALAIATGCGIAFADVHVNFYNKVYSDEPIVRHHPRLPKVEDPNAKRKAFSEDTYYPDEKFRTDIYFPGIKEEMYADISTDKVDAGVKGIMTLGQSIDSNHFRFEGVIDDWWVEFRPINMLTLGLHDSIYADGSYLPIWDDNVTGGNVGSDGFTAVVTPIKGLRFAGTVPSGMDKGDGYNWINGTKKSEARYEEHCNFHFGLGAIFDYEDVFQVGASFQGIPCNYDRQFGVYVNMPGFFGLVKELSIGAGYTHAWTKFHTHNGNRDSHYGEQTENVMEELISWAGLTYEDLLNLYVSYDAGKFGVTAELAFNFSDDKNLARKYEYDDDRYRYSYGRNDIYDLYSALSVSFGLAKNLTATATGKMLLDFADDNDIDPGFGAALGVDYELDKRNMLGAKVEVNVVDEYWDVAVPVYWKYTLEY